MANKDKDSNRENKGNNAPKKDSGAHRRQKSGGNGSKKYWNRGQIMAMSYECWAYKNGKPDKMVHVTANSKSEAEALAWEKFRNLGIKPDSVRCKWI